MVKIGRDDIGPGYYEVQCDSCSAFFFTNDSEAIDGPKRFCPSCKHRMSDESADGTGD